MGAIEKRVKKRTRRVQIQRTVLTTIAVAGIVAWTALAPNTLQLLKYAPGMRRSMQTRANRARNNLVARGLLEEVYVGKVRSLRITKRGEVVLARLSAAEARLKPPSRWDEHWRIVIFDVPERRRGARDKLRIMLESIGFKKLQASVWIFPYECEDLLLLLKTEYSLGREVIYIVSKDVENDNVLRRKFGLVTS